jgi:hypothetical protein
MLRQHFRALEAMLQEIRDQYAARLIVAIDGSPDDPFRGNQSESRCR